MKSMILTAVFMFVGSAGLTATASASSPGKVTADCCGAKCCPASCCETAVTPAFASDAGASSPRYELRRISQGGSRFANVLVRVDRGASTAPYALTGESAREASARRAAANQWVGPRHLGAVGGASN